MKDIFKQYKKWLCTILNFVRLAQQNELLLFKTCNTVSQEKYDDHLSGLKCLVNKTAQFYGDIIDHYATLKNSRIDTTKKK